MSLDDYSAVVSAERILAGIESERLSRTTTEQRIRLMLAEQVDACWLTCYLEQHVSPDSRIQYVAVRICTTSWQIRTIIVEVLPGGELSRSEPISDEW